MNKQICKTVGSLLLAAVLMIGSLTAFALPVYGAAQDLEEKDVTVCSVDAGRSGSGSFSLKNTSAAPITATVQISVAAEDQSVLVISGGSTSGVTISAGSTQRISYTVHAAESAAKKIYTVPVTVTWTDAEEAPQTLNFTVPVKVSTYQDETIYDPSDYAYHPVMTAGYSIASETGTIVAGKEAKLNITLQNKGTCNLSNCTIQLGGLDRTISIYNGKDRNLVGSVNANKSATAAFDLWTDETMTSGVYAFPVILTGEDPNGTSHTVSETLYIYVKGTDGETVKPEDPSDLIHTPILMVDKYSQNGTAMAGGTFTLNLSVLNTAPNTLYNVKVTVGSGGGVFVPSGSSNAYYVAEIPAGTNSTKSIQLTVSPDAPQATVPVDISMSYEDVNGNKYGANDTIAIPVKQETRLVIDDMSPISWAYAGESTSSQIQFYNMGKNTINNLKVSVSGDFNVTKNPTLFVGNMASGQSSTFKFTLMPYEGGIANGVITFTYDDAAGMQQTVEQPFSFEVQTWDEPTWDEPGWDDPGMMEPVPQEKPFPWKWVGLGGGVVLIAALLIIRKARKKKAAKALELEDAEEE